jgi:hypothetical protein
MNKSIKEQDRPTSTTANAMLVKFNGGFSFDNVEPFAESTANGDSTFPFKLYDILENASAEGFDHIVSWMPNGNGFKLHDREQFKKTIVARYFNQSHYKSFIRQLNIYDFQRQEGERGSSYSRDFFVRVERFLCGYMKRYIIKTNRTLAGTKRIGLVHGDNKGCCFPSHVVKNEPEEHCVLTPRLQWCMLEHLLPNRDDHDRLMDITSFEDDGSADFEPDPILVTDQMGVVAPRLLKTTCIGPDLASDIIAMFRRSRVSV